MTRFARSKGSKASNERVPEAATSWSEMKEQLDEKLKEGEYKKNQQEAEQLRSKNYKKFLKEKEDEEINNTKWADLSDLVENQTVKKPQKAKTSLKRKNETDVTNKRKKVKVESNAANNNIKKTSTDCKVNNEAIINKKKKNILPPLKPISELSAAELKQLKKKKERRQRQSAKRKLRKAMNTNPVNSNSNDTKSDDANNNPKQPPKNVVKKPKEQLTEIDLKKIASKREKHKKQLEKKKQFKEINKQQANDESNNTNNTNKKVFTKPTNNKNSKFGIDKKPKPLKLKNGVANRRKPMQPLEKLTINGNDLELVRFEGFPVKKEDAERLIKLKKEMISKGIPRSEVNVALKLERRKAEKALSREKKTVCFNCRIAGHVLSECPNLNNEEVGTGICFKCGSTEHTHFECKIIKNQEFKFATCFICKEQGHIARQCPDNARGLYPKGGACRLCGDVTHLKKDCPQFHQEQETNNIYAEKICDSIEALEPQTVTAKPTTRPNKVIKF